jgi:hypothetical protein
MGGKPYVSGQSGAATNFPIRRRDRRRRKPNLGRNLELGKMW